MNPTEHTFKYLTQFVELVQSYPPLLWIYRGQTDVSWPLCPKAGRREFYLRATQPWIERGQTSGDLGRLKEWREHAIAFCQQLPENDFECLAFAQHYGLATRLLDWSSNPLVALFFAAEGKEDCDGAVYCYAAQRLVDPKILSPETCSKVVTYQPRPFDRRILAQAGKFTFHPRPEIPLEAGPIEDENKTSAPNGVDLVVLRVPGATKRILQRQLCDVGVTRKTLFPDLEGLSSFVNWETTRSVEAANRR